MHTQAVSRLLTERALRRALEHDELRVLFQPQFDLATGRPGRGRGAAALEPPGAGLWSCPATSSASPRRPASSCPSASGCSSARATCCARPPPTAHAAERAVGRRPTCPPDSCSGPTSPPSSPARVAGLRASTRDRLCLEVAESALLDDLDATGDALRGAQGARRTARHRRLRHRRVVAHLPAAVPVRRAEDRPHVRRGPRPERGRRRDRRRHHRHGPRARHDRDRRGRRDGSSSGCASASSAATVRRATTSGAPEELAARRLVLVEQRPA